MYILFHFIYLLLEQNLHKAKSKSLILQFNYVVKIVLLVSTEKNLVLKENSYKNFFSYLSHTEGFSGDN